MVGGVWRNLIAKELVYWRGFISWLHLAFGIWYLIFGIWWAATREGCFSCVGGTRREEGEAKNRLKQGNGNATRRWWMMVFDEDFPIAHHLKITYWAFHMAMGISRVQGSIHVWEWVALLKKGGFCRTNRHTQFTTCVYITSIFRKKFPIACLA